MAPILKGFQVDCTQLVVFLDKVLAHYSKRSVQEKPSFFSAGNEPAHCLSNLAKCLVFCCVQAVLMILVHGLHSWAFYAEIPLSI